MTAVRIMRIITLNGFAIETGPGQYQANETTGFCVKKGVVGDVKY